MGTTRLALYNKALRLCGERKLASLTENRKPRHDLDAVWEEGGARACLEEAQWRFAMRAIRLDYDPSITPDFGFTYAFAKPDDWVATSALCWDEHFRVPLTQYEDEAGYWYADVEPLYVRYVSDDTAFGMDLGNWTQAFTDYVAAYFAAQIVMGLTADKAKAEALLAPRSGILSRALDKAKSMDAMAGPVRFKAQGAWTASRGGRVSGDRGRRGRLIG